MGREEGPGELAQAHIGERHDVAWSEENRVSVIWLRAVLKMHVDPLHFCERTARHVHIHLDGMDASVESDEGSLILLAPERAEQ